MLLLDTGLPEYYRQDYVKSTGSATTKKPPEIAVFSLKVERQKLERFKEAAESKQRTASQQLRWYIDREVREFNANGEAA